MRLAVAGPVAALALTLAACTDGQERELGQTGYVQGFYGGVAGDEPNAVLVARDILSSGGSAADAAVAMSFAMTVTYPSAVTLGGGGTCVVHDAALGVTEALDFIPPAGSGPAGQRPTAVPALTRGMAALHARYGRLDWRATVAPAEQRARLGHRASRAFVSRLTAAADALFRDPATRDLFSGPEGRPVQVGQRLRQPDLAGVLGRIRSKGGGALYAGPYAQTLVEAYREAGGSLTAEDLRGYTPEWRTTVLLPHGNDELHFAPPPAGSGLVSAQVLGMLSAGERYAGAGAAEARAHMLAEASTRALADRRDWLGPDNFGRPESWAERLDPAYIADLFASYDPERRVPPELPDAAGEQVQSLAGTGFVVADRDGMAVACELTNYYPFGIGRVAPGTGIIPAAAPTHPGRNPLSLGPMLAINANSLKLRYGVAASGGPFAQATLSGLTADVLFRDVPVKEAIAAERVLGVDRPPVTVLESGAAPLEAALEDRGHQLQVLDWPGRAAVLHCPNGLPRSDDDSICAVAHDPRGNGLSTMSEPGS